MHALSDEEQVARLEKKVDDGFAKIDDRFARVDDRFARVDAKVDAGFAKVDQRLGGMRAEIGAVREGARSDFRTLLAINLTMVVAMIFGFGGIVIALLTHHV
jgi:hypothetical protein